MAQRQQAAHYDYEAFIEKFEPKKTTDDCYTPPRVFETIKDWACHRYGIDPAKIVRPFYPGGDYQAFDYPEDAVVLDNPPFSIISEIVRWYASHNIPYFLFCPGLTAFSNDLAFDANAHLVFADAQITYENGAKVPTAFVTSYGENLAETAPDLHRVLRDVQKNPAPIVSYKYPDHIITSAAMNGFAKYGIEFAIDKSEAVGISALDEQRGCGKTIFGKGLLLSDQAARRNRAAREKAAREKAAREWTLSKRELEIVASLNQATPNRP